MLFSGPHPAITPAQIASLLTVVVSQIVAWGWIDNDTAKVVISVGGFAIAGVWKAADAYLRGARAKSHPVATITNAPPPPTT
jgi:hypothetical protein